MSGWVPIPKELGLLQYQVLPGDENVYLSSGRSSSFNNQRPTIGSVLNLKGPSIACGKVPPF